MSYRKNITKTLFFVVILTVFLPSLLTPIIGLNNSESNPSLNVVYEKVHKGFLFNKGTLDALVSVDIYNLELKTGKPYIFRIKVDTPIGGAIFVTLIGQPGYAAPGTWAAEDDESLRKIEFIYTPFVTGNQTLLIAKIFPLDMNENAYSVYVNLNGFAGIWWMIAAGLGALVLILIIPIAIIRSKRKKKKKGKKRKR